MKVHDAAQNLEQVQAGDKVRVRYLESTAIYLRRGDRDVPAAAQVDDVQLAAKDASAGGVAIQKQSSSKTGNRKRENIEGAR